MLIELDCDRYLVVNQTTGAVNVVRAEWWNRLHLAPLRSKHAATFQAQDSTAPHVLLSDHEQQLLRRSGYLDAATSKSGFDDRFRSFANMKRQIHPHSIFIAPQLTCPMECVYCFENRARSYPSTKPGQLIENVSVLERYIEEYRQDRDLAPDRITVVLFGGEPLVPALREFNRKLLEYASERGYKWRVNTSGVCLDDYYLDLIKTHSANLQEVDITVDGPPAIHNALRPLRGGTASYPVIAQTVNRLLASKIRVMVKTNLGKATTQHLEPFLDLMINSGWFADEYFLYATNVVRRFGQTHTADEYVDEDQITIRLVEAFRKDRYRQLLPKLRLEGLRITEYLANAFGLLTIQCPGGEPSNKFDAYPRVAFCHPGEGTALNISYDGSVYTCNWMAGKPAFSIGSIFDGLSGFRRDIHIQQTKPVTDRPFCEKCDLYTLCGGGCSIDRSELPYFSRDCHQYFSELLRRFVSECFRRSWIPAELGSANILVLRDSFDFDYQYQDRTQRSALAAGAPLT